MNLLCPNCQKMLTVPDQYAGQLMKCPMCQGTFTVPALPQPAFGAPEPPPPAPPPGPAGGEIFSFQPSEPPPAPAFQTAPPMELPPAAPPSAPPPPPPPDSSARLRAELEGRPYTPSAPSLPPEGYHKTLTIWFSPRVLQWVPPAAMLLIFVLLFFTWVCVCPGGVSYITQSGWGTLSGGYTEDQDMRSKDAKAFRMATDKELEGNKDRAEKERIKDYRPSFSVLMLFYVMLFIPSLLVALALAVLPLLKNVKLPPIVTQLLPWRFALIAALNALLLLFLGLQLLLGFSLENQFKDYVNDLPLIKKEQKTTVEQKEADVLRGTRMEYLERTYWLRLVVVFHLLAVVAAVLVFWVNKRGEHRPIPKLELMW